MYAPSPSKNQAPVQQGSASHLHPPFINQQVINCNNGSSKNLNIHNNSQ